MVYENVGDLWQHLLSGIDLSELTEKIISVVITIIVFFILIKVSNGLVNKFFNENKKNYISYTYYVCYVGLHNTYCKSGRIVFGKIRYDESKSRQDGRCYERSGSA